MPERISVFYSWQSDTPSQLNRSFIEKALGKAIKQLGSNAELDPALRDKTIELDKDTKGVSGSPPITETILKKIEQCSAFVADLTFIAESTPRLQEINKATRLSPNPNVLIEYGYSLSQHGHGHLVTVMNTAFGECTTESLPFDLRHLRWPITYHLDEKSDDTKKREALENLTKQFKQALSAILAQAQVSKNSERKPIQHQSHTSDRSVFFDDPSDLIPEAPFGEAPGLIVIPNEGRAYLRLKPLQASLDLKTELEARDLANRGGLRPMGKRLTGWNATRNLWGAIVYEPPFSGKLNHYTQLFLNGEVWGMNAYALNLSHCKEFSPKAKHGYVASGYVEEMLVETLANYLKFYASTLHLSTPIGLEIGLLGIKDYSIAHENSLLGRILQNDIIWQEEVRNLATPAHEILKPLFELLWAKGGVNRPSQRDTSNANFS